MFTLLDRPDVPERVLLSLPTFDIDSDPDGKKHQEGVVIGSVQDREIV